MGQNINFESVEGEILRYAQNDAWKDVSLGPLSVFQSAFSVILNEVKDLSYPFVNST